MHIENCTYENSADQILAILNEAIVSSTALYDYQLRTAASMVAWFKAKETGHCRGMGIGFMLMQRLIAEAVRQNYHTMVGGIDASNLASEASHQKLGFQHAGTIKHAGFKFGRWLDLSFYQLLLETPKEPVDG